jgi:hypothetical protein
MASLFINLTATFFTGDGNKFKEVRVYMAGENTLDHANQT